MFHRVFHMPAYRWGASRLTNGGNGMPAGLPLGEPTRGTKKTPDSRGYCRGFRWQVVSWGYLWVIYGFTPAGLQSHCTVQIRIRQYLRKIYFFSLKYMLMLTKLLTTYHNGGVPGPKWQGKSTFIVHVNQSSETTGPHVHLFPFLFT